MARPLKTGLDYFPMDIDFYEDEKIELLWAKYGLIGEAIATRLLAKIYRNGYFIEWNEDKSLLFKKKMGGEIDIDGIINELLERDFFDKGLYQKYGILTSRGIQKRYIRICQEAKRKKYSILVNYDLIGFNSEETPVNSGKLPEETPVNPEFSTQRKEKESKEKKRREETIQNPEETPCTVEEVLKFCSLNEIPEDEGRMFYENYQAEGWRTNSTPPKKITKQNWMNHLKIWALRSKNFNTGPPRKKKDEDDKIIKLKPIGYQD